MSNVIEFLESMGQDAKLRRATSAEVERALARTQMDAALRAGILSGNQNRLEALLAAKTNLCCMVHVPENDDDAGQGEGLATRLPACTA